MKLPRTTPEQRQELYKDVRSLIWPGFIAQTVSVNGVGLALRTLSADDIDLLRWRVPAKTFTIHEWKAWSVAMSAWMVDGQVVLGDSDALYRLYQMFKGLPLIALDTLYGIWTTLMKRLDLSSDQAEAFLYEQESRYIWKADGSFMGSRRVYGTEPLPLNPIQRLWAYYNQMEDEREQDAHDWEMSRFVVGPHAPKGIKKLQSKDAQHQSDMKRKRQAVMDRCYYETQGIIPSRKDKKRIKGPWQDIRTAETEEELQEEMGNWVKGVKDDHDRVVDGIKARIRHGVEGRRKHEEERSRALQQALDEEGLTEKNQLTPLSGEKGQEFLDRMRTKIGGTKFVFDDHTHNSAYDKYIRNNPEVGNLRVDEEGNITSTSNLPVTEDMLQMLTQPDENEKSELQKEVENRRPIFHTEEDS